MTVRLALTTSSAAKFLALATVAGIAGGGYTLACMTSGADDGQTNSVALADQTSQTTTAITSEVDDPSSRSAVNAPIASTSTRIDSTPESTPTPNLRGLCTAFRAHHEDNPDHWKSSTAFQILIRAAGGSDLRTVTTYCATVVPARSEETSEDPSEEASEDARRSRTPEALPSRSDDGSDASDAPDADGPHFPGPAPTGTVTRGEWQPLGGLPNQH